MAHTGCPGGPFMMTQVVLGDHLCRGPVNSLQDTEDQDGHSSDSGRLIFRLDGANWWQ